MRASLSETEMTRRKTASVKEETHSERFVSNPLYTKPAVNADVAFDEAIQRKILGTFFETHAILLIFRLPYSTARNETWLTPKMFVQIQKRIFDTAIVRPFVDNFAPGLYTPL